SSRFRNFLEEAIPLTAFPSEPQKRMGAAAGGLGRWRGLEKIFGGGTTAPAKPLTKRYSIVAMIASSGGVRRSAKSSWAGRKCAGKASACAVERAIAYALIA